MTNPRAAAIRLTLLAVGLLTAGQVRAALDLRSATVDTLDNGLTVILLVDRNFPVASVQMLYKVGARNEVTGKTGIAHFLEHMAFRASDEFPGTGLVSSIYARGGEWHGYTWTDQTTYFATVPAADLDLLLRIEADRMTRLALAEDAMEAERGAVLAEMHMYENYPTSMLIDALMFTSFQAHPYRNNTIGFESDIENLQHADVVDFYKQHYHPGNAVLAIVGDFDAGRVGERIGALFGGIPGQPATPLPHTTEPLQNGERRVSISGSSHARRFMIGYRAPSANDADYPAFLVLQELLGASSGVSFLQNDWGSPVAPQSLLAGAAAELTTWYPPAAQDYIFVIGGVAEKGVTEPATEAAIEKLLATARRAPPASATLAQAIASVQDQLVFDVETTEDAAHQLAFFEGLGALNVLLTLHERVAAVTATDVQRVANRYLEPERRTIAWYGPADVQPASNGSANTPSTVLPVQKAPGDDRPVPAAVVSRLRGGIPAIIQPSDLSSSLVLQVVVRGNNFGGAGITGNDPVRGYSSLRYKVRPHALRQQLRTAAGDLAEIEVVMQPSFASSDSPETRLEEVFDEMMRRELHPGSTAAVPALLVVSGDVDVDEARGELQDVFGSFDVPARETQRAAGIDGGEQRVSLGVPVAQAALGYIVVAPGPGDARFDAFRLLLYILSHDYEGRLGVEAISKRGLAYYIDSRYRSDGVNGWITLAVGVDPHKMAALKALLKTELQRLVDAPPTMAELQEAKTYFLGRATSAAQSNTELANALAEQWLWFDTVLTREKLEQRLHAVSHTNLQQAAADFASGMTIIVAE